MRGKIISLAFIVLSGLIGCTTTISEIGTDIFNKNTFDVAYLDSITIKTSTIMGDSIATSNASRLLVGYHQDPKLGSVTAQSIFQVGVRLSGTDYPIVLDRLTTEYIGLRIWLKPDKYSFYDTMQEQTISVYRVKKEMKEFNGYLFNTSKFYTDNTPLGSVTFKPHPRKADSLEIPLSDVLGKALMTLAQTNDPTVAINLNFLQYLRGLALVPDTTSSGAILGFGLNPELRLYYLDKSVTPTVVRHASFRLASNFYYNKIHAWRAGTKINSIKKFGDAISSNDTDNEIYFQAGVGLGARIDMPYLRTLLYNDRNFTFTRAILEIRPVNPSVAINPLPQTLAIYAVNQQNRSLTGVPYAGRLIKDYDLGANTHYEVDVTSFVNSQIQNDLFNQNGLLVNLDDATFRSGVDSNTLGDTKNFYKMKIRLYYLTLSNSTN